MARRDPVGIRLITRKGNDWTNRYPLVVEAVNHLKVRSCLIDGEVVCCDEKVKTEAPAEAGSRGGLGHVTLIKHRSPEPWAAGRVGWRRAIAATRLRRAARDRAPQSWRAR